MNTPPLLLFGHDTVECAYYLMPLADRSWSFERLAAEKELLRLSKSREGQPLVLGSESFLLAGHGTGSGYPFLLQNAALAVQCGEFNKPNFFVTFRSQALWQFGLPALHRRVLAWAESVGLLPYREERLSRVDFSFDFQLAQPDFDENSFVSVTVKDAQYRRGGQLQSLRFGEGATVLRMYDKAAEIAEQSQKTWFHALWGGDLPVWRVEWQVRKEALKPFGLRTVADLAERQGDLLRYLATAHTSLRVPTADSNRSRWPLHPVWAALVAHLEQLDSLGVVREFDPARLLDERLLRLMVSIYGYSKRIAAITGLQQQRAEVGLEETLAVMQRHLHRLHDPLSWEGEVSRRMVRMQLGE